ncbi:hypothetical protein JCM31598_36230 [Desulfonatronum parangueonense]
MIFSKVDFPEPFGPIRPMRSPSEKPSEMFVNKGCAVKVLLKPVMDARIVADMARMLHDIAPHRKSRIDGGAAEHLVISTRATAGNYSA